MWTLALVDAIHFVLFHSNISISILQTKNITVGKNEKEVPLFDHFPTVWTSTQFLLMTTQIGAKVFAPFTGPGTFAFASILTGQKFYGFVCDSEQHISLNRTFGQLTAGLIKNPVEVYTR